MTYADRIGVSTISFRHRPLREALDIIERLGAREVDLGAIPAVTDHVPVPFTANRTDYVTALAEHNLRSGAVNCDVGDLNDPDHSQRALRGLAQPLIELAAATEGALIVPCGRADYAPFVDEAADLALIGDNLRALSSWCAVSGVRLLVEVLHHKRFVHSVETADLLLRQVGPEVFGLLFDVSHIVASKDDPVAWAAALGPRVERVHLRDAVPGDLNVGIGRGVADFAGTIAALEGSGFTGTYVLELETHDVDEADREADAARSRALATDWLAQAHT